MMRKWAKRRVMIAGINRIRRKSLSLRRDALLPAADLDELEKFDAETEAVISQFGRRFAALQTLGDRVTRYPLTTGNTIDMSRATYARQFRERAGMTVGAFLTDIRMMLASDLLLRTRRTVADIAAEVGYESEAAFGKAFKARRGITPARYRSAEQARQAGKQ